MLTTNLQIKAGTTKPRDCYIRVLTTNLLTKAGTTKPHDCDTYVCSQTLSYSGSQPTFRPKPGQGNRMTVLHTCVHNTELQWFTTNLQIKAGTTEPHDCVTYVCSQPTFSSKPGQRNHMTVCVLHTCVHNKPSDTRNRNHEPLREAKRNDEVFRWSTSAPDGAFLSEGETGRCVHAQPGHCHNIPMPSPMLASALIQTRGASQGQALKTANTAYTKPSGAGRGCSTPQFTRGWKPWVPK